MSDRTGTNHRHPNDPIGLTCPHVKGLTPPDGTWSRQKLWAIGAVVWWLVDFNPQFAIIDAGGWEALLGVVVAARRPDAPIRHQQGNRMVVADDRGRWVGRPGVIVRIVG